MEARTISTGDVISALERHCFLFPGPYEELVTMGIRWRFEKPPLASRSYFQGPRSLMALVTYRRLFGNCHVPHKFCVPEHTTWPVVLHKSGIGATVNGLRSNYSGLLPATVATYNTLGFVWFFPNNAVKCKRFVNGSYTSIAVPVAALVDARNVPHDSWPLRRATRVLHTRRGDKMRHKMVWC
ncbi:hypothetical protein ACHHYP_14966 [Achlya hypogyna]|uniref:Uncharacterized protein n=1 Tax=Achlya hypogyna TaxID=1202772 RepID=A0A1V9YC07_ACHHY|nr:hypothetical protein ACHHYP_14966 [Achlya hypogyna]